MRAFNIVLINGERFVEQFPDKASAIFTYPDIHSIWPMGKKRQIFGVGWPAVHLQCRNKRKGAMDTWFVSGSEIKLAGVKCDVCKEPMICKRQRKQSS